GPVDDRTHLLGPDHEHGIAAPGGEVALGQGEPVDEPRASGREVECRGVGRADLALDLTGGRGEESIRRRRRDEDQVDLVGRDTGAVEGRTGRLGPHRRGTYRWVGDAPLPYPRALTD